jgi:hypothetical protein
MTQWIFKPFTYVAGTKALIAGLAVMTITAVLARYSFTHFDGVLDVHIGAATPLAVYALEPAIAWAAATAIFYLAGLIMSATRPRLVDIAGTMALSRTPLLLTAIVAFGQPANISITNMPPAAWVIAIVLLLCVAWMVVLMYNAFSTSANMKGARAALTFTCALIAAEVVSKIAFHYLYQSL